MLDKMGVALLELLNLVALVWAVDDTLWADWIASACEAVVADKLIAVGLAWSNVTSAASKLSH